MSSLAQGERERAADLDASQLSTYYQGGIVSVDAGRSAPALRCQLGVLGVVLGRRSCYFVLLPALLAAARRRRRPGAGAPAAAARRRKAAPARPIDVRLDALGKAAARRGPSDGARRNPFRMGAAPPPPGAGGGRGARRRRSRSTPVVAAPVGPPPPPPCRRSRTGSSACSPACRAGQDCRADRRQARGSRPRTTDRSTAAIASCRSARSRCRSNTSTGAGARRSGCRANECRRPNGAAQPSRRRAPSVEHVTSSERCR